MNDEVERLSSVLDDLAAEYDPALRHELTAEEAQMVRAAAFLKGADVERLTPRDEFVTSLAARVRERCSAEEQSAVAPDARGRLSRRGVLGRVAAAVAGIAAGAAGVAAYEEGKRTGYREEASDSFTAPMVPEDRGVWLETGHTAQALAPGLAVRFRAGALEGFLVNPGRGRRVYALSAVCTHMGCMLTWLETAGTFLCPCHGAQYNADGSVLSGIARHPLPHLPVRLDGDGRYQVWSVPEHPRITTLAPYEST